MRAPPAIMNANSASLCQCSSRMPPASVEEGAFMTETPQEAGGSKDGGRLSRPDAAVGGDLRLGYDAGVTGLSAMVAFNLLFAIFSVALLALFVWGRLLESQALEASALEDLRGLFPAASESTLTG